MLIKPLAVLALAHSAEAAPAPLLQARDLDAALASIDEAARDLRISITPGVWLARTGGDVTLGPAPGATELNLEEDFDLDDNEGAFNLEVAISPGGNWQIDASGFDFSTEADGVFPRDAIFGDLAIAAGDAYDASFDMTSVALEVSYWQWHVVDSRVRGRSTDLWFAYGAGVRWLGVEQRLELAGTGLAAEGEGEWFVPSLVMRMHLRHELDPGFPVLQAFEVLAAGTVGPAFGGAGGAVLTLRAGVRAWLCQNFSLDFGYRLMHANVESDDYELNGGLQGLFLSGTVRF